MALHLLLNFQCFLVLLCLQLASTTELPISKPGCQNKCGNVSIPYPFGIGESCSIGGWFNLTCDDTLLDNIRPLYGSLNVSNISIFGSEMTLGLGIVTNCSDKSIQVNNHWIGARLSDNFSFSSTKNKFIAIGCDTLAYIVGKGDQDSSVGTGCMSYCNKREDTTDGTCNGVGCCEASIPSGLVSYDTILGSMYSPRRNLTFNPCSYAFLAEKSSFNFSSSYLKNFGDNGALTVPIVVDWTIGRQTCEEAQKSLTNYACGPNTECISAGRDVEGYRCSCRTGYEGNPYLNMSTYGHCQDIDECTTNLNICGKGPGNICKNVEGSYNCSCDQGYSLDVRNNITDCILEIQSNLPKSQSTQNNSLNKIVL
ncbi:hypothetical protein MKW94_011941, partial [Papaver nudicaule]|nr:hypothetical protein [Papaver nudicaule]MCL7037990.1 hypothetical protein [Papaver nudicaule]